MPISYYMGLALQALPSPQHQPPQSVQRDSFRECSPLRLHTCNFATVVHLSSQCHFRLLFHSQPLTLFALLFNQSPVCISRLGCHREGCTTLAGCAHCLCPSPAPSCQVPPKNFHHAPAVASANSSFCTLHNCLWISLSAIPSLSFSSLLIFSVPIGNFPL